MYLRNEHAGRRCGVRGVKQTNTKRPAVGPAGKYLKVAKSIGSSVSAIFG